MDTTFGGIERRMAHLEREIKANFHWLLALYGAGFLTLLGLMAHGFKWY